MWKKHLLVTCYLLLTGVEAKALFAPSATVLETILERYDSFSIDDMCRQLIPLYDYSVAEKNSFEFPAVISVSWVCTGGLECCNADHPDEKQLESTFSFPVNNFYVSTRSLLNLRFSNVVRGSLFKRCSYDKLLSPFTNLVAFRWTRSRHAMSLRIYGDQAWIAYSKCGQTKPLYRIIKLLLSNIWNCFLSYPKLYWLYKLLEHTVMKPSDC